MTFCLFHGYILTLFLPTNKFQTINMLPMFQSLAFEDVNTNLTPEENDLLNQLMQKQEGISLTELQETSYAKIHDAIGQSQIILLGESTHGTEEFYRIRADLTKSLIRDKGFDAVLCEGSFSSFWYTNRFITERPHTNKPHYLLNKGIFQDNLSFPNWLWNNNAMLDFVLWLRNLNESHRQQQIPVQLIGMDILDIFQSIDDVINFLKTTNENQLEELAHACYSELIHFRPHAFDYGKAVYGKSISSQVDRVLRIQDALLEKSDYLCQLGIETQELFGVFENARIIRASEAYYRQSIFPGYPVNWNLRDASFLDSVKNAIAYIASLKKMEEAKVRVIVWAHNSHVGDARATGYAANGQISLGQLCRQYFGKNKVYIVGLSTSNGTVRASKQEGGYDEITELKRPLYGSHENCLHVISKIQNENAFGFTFRSNSCNGNDVDEAARRFFDVERFERFVGSSYLPESEVQSHYSVCRLSQQFDFLLHVDRTNGLQKI